MVTWYLTIAVDVPLRGAFTWTHAAEEDDQTVWRGYRAMVPWQSGFRTGIVLSQSRTAPANVDDAALRPVLAIADDQRFVPEPQLALAEWASRYYLAPIGECIRLTVPPSGLPDAEALVVATKGGAGGTRPTWSLALSTDTPTPLRTLLDRRLATLRDIMGAVREGWIQLEAPTARTGIRQQVVERLTLTPLADPAAPRLGPRQRQVLEHLAQWGESTWDELRESLEIDRGVLRGLLERGWVAVEREQVWRDPFADAPLRPRGADPALHPHQLTALDAIARQLDERKAGTFLLQGVTGSGKTEVYLRAVRHAMAQGRNAVILLPEIALTPQFVGVFRSALGDAVAVQHSGLTPAQRHDQWMRIRSGEVPLVIGARSALFAPMPATGLIVVDEEHDPSFKQDTGVHYHARDLAVVLAQSVGATLVLGSATPSLESIGNVQRQRYTLLTMPQRVAERPMPSIELVDMRGAAPDPDDPASHLLSPVLQSAVVQNARAGQQSILFLNRRGFAPMLTCTSCEQSLMCPHCDIAVTYHARGNMARCHYCGFSTRVPKQCPTCSSESLQPEGAGTEQLESTLETAFQGLRVIRLDADSSRSRGLHRVLDAFRRGDADVLVGTQMVTKGHDFPGVTLVGVVQADQSLRFPDFRSGERTFQLLTQVSGRAGRAEQPGRVMIQTWNPAHPVLQAVLKGDADGWRAQELHFRQRMEYPPFGAMTLVRVHAPDRAHALEVAQGFADVVRAAFGHSIRCIGPQDAPISRVRDRWRIHLLLRGPDRGRVHAASRAVLDAWGERDAWMRRHDVRADIDVDPLNLL